MPEVRSAIKSYKTIIWLLHFCALIKLTTHRLIDQKITFSIKFDSETLGISPGIYTTAI